MPMEYDMEKTLLQFIAVSAAYLIGGAAIAQTAAPSGGTASTAAVASTSGSPQVSRLAADFGDFAGSDANAAALVTGLRNGTPITLAETAVLTTTTGNPPVTTATTVTTNTTITPPTGHMGWGNVRHALTLARAQLAAQGISEPSAAQIQAALTGGSITTVGANGSQSTQLPGILTLRSQHMGWGRIAQTVGVKPGAFANANAKATSGGSGTITTASGATVSRHGASGSTASTGVERGKSTSHGRVSAAGSASRTFSHGHAAGAQSGRHLATATGASFGHSRGGGNASGHGKR